MVDLNPLEILLRRLAEGRVYDLRELAYALGMDEALVEQMLQHLESAGYLRTVAGECQRGCAHCAYQAVCALTQGGRIWALTERGRQAAERLG